jgi:tripeptide aminopeptidase
MSDKLVQDFMDFVKIPSESGEEKEFIEYLKKLFTDEFGAKCEVDDYGNLIVNIAARNSSRTEPVLISTHADTVKPGKGIEPVLDNGVIRSKGETILGADDKAGIAEVFDAIRTADSHPALEIVISREEEIGLVGARHVDVSRLRSKMGFLIDMDTIDSIVIGGPSHVLIDVVVIGKAAHAGMEPEKGISAVVAASLGISKLQLGRIDEETTANVGIIEGGIVRNGVPEKVTITAECRSLDHEKCMKLADEMKRTFETAAASIGARADVKSELAYKAVQISENAEPVNIAKKALRSAGLEPRVHLICGGTDASIYNNKGIETVILGFGGKAEHSNDENIAVSDMETGVKMIKNILEQLSG